jgi:hypothetical protein
MAAANYTEEFKDLLKDATASQFVLLGQQLRRACLGEYGKPANLIGGAACEVRLAQNCLGVDVVEWGRATTECLRRERVEAFGRCDRVCHVDRIPRRRLVQQAVAAAIAHVANVVALGTAPPTEELRIAMEMATRGDCGLSLAAVVADGGATAETHDASRLVARACVMSFVNEIAARPTEEHVTVLIAVCDTGIIPIASVIGATQAHLAARSPGVTCFLLACRHKSFHTMMVFPDTDAPALPLTVWACQQWAAVACVVFGDDGSQSPAL